MELDGLTTQHVPLLFYSPSFITPQRIDKTCSQLDFAIRQRLANPFIIQQLGKIFLIQLKEFALKIRHFYLILNIKQIGIVTDEYCYVT